MRKVGQVDVIPSNQSISFRITATVAIGVAALMAAGSTVPAASAQASAPSGSLKIITWVNPPAVQALTKIDKEFMEKYPGVKVRWRRRPT